MFEWFEAHAPIRIKFQALLILQVLFAIGGVAATLLAGGGALPLALAGIVGVLMIATIAIASTLICRPYVTTVVRMEALAAGDTANPFEHAHHTDCVGRMIQAMTTFRDNAVEVQTSREAQERIVSALSEGMRKLAENELTYRITQPFPSGYDALRTDFNAALAALARTIDSVRDAAASVLNGAAEIRAASDDLSLRNEQQAASLEETSAAMNEVTRSVMATAEDAREVQKAVANAHHEATDGGEVVRRATQAMDAIEASASKINQIINVIDGIAFQTNLLALNAGVEAARAGDAGKGFAVVANEVRALAQRSADAARDIKELITASTAQVSSGVALVADTGTLLGNIVGKVGEINSLATTIAESAERQAANLQQVNSAVGEMDRMTQQNAAMVEQSTAASRSLSDEATTLNTIVAQFHTDRAGNRRANAAPARHRPAPAAARIGTTRGAVALKAVPSPQEDDWDEF